jgi:peptide/nickel transport system substrate-binding protein
VKELQKCLARDSEIYPEGEISGYFGNKTKEAVIKFQEKYKKEILEPQGLEKGTGEVLKATRTKLNEICFGNSEEVIPLEFSLVTVNQPVLKEVATQVQQQWEALGVKVEIKTFDISSLEREVIKPRNYEVLLFGEVLGQIPDLFPFWHSSQKRDPGLNLAMYENKKSDKLLEEVRESLDENIRKEKLEEFQDILIEDAPAVFLYNPDYLYLVSKEIKGVNTKTIVDPSKRFSGIDGWYIKTKRVW